MIGCAERVAEPNVLGQNPSTPAWLEQRIPSGFNNLASPQALVLVEKQLKIFLSFFLPFLLSCFYTWKFKHRLAMASEICDHTVLISLASSLSRTHNVEVFSHLRSYREAVKSNSNTCRLIDDYMTN